MNSIHLLRKTILSDSSFRSLLSCAKVHKCRILDMSSAADVKAHTGTLSKTRNSNSLESDSNRTDSDSFGTLKTSLEDKFKRDSRLSYKPEKKIIKIKKPKSTESDEFGNLSEEKAIWYPEVSEESKLDNDLSDDSILVKSLSKRFRCPRRYLQEMKTLVGQKKIKEALDLFVDMRRNFVAPIHPHYTYMIGVCGKVGYTEMAFQLLKQMTDRTFKPTPATLTGLFNSCAESPYPEYGLKKARLLREKIEAKNWEVNQITYHSMIKAFGKCGDLKTAFMIVDEMAKANIEIDVSTYSFLLVSCIANKTVGFTYAVEVWRKMKAKKCKPNVFTCNLLLRATRDCETGPEEISSLLLQHWSSYSKRPYGFITKETLSKSKDPVMELGSGLNNTDTKSVEGDMKEEYHAIEAQKENLEESFKEDRFRNELQNISSKSVVTSSTTPVPSVLLARPINGPEILEIRDLKTPSDRLSLLGGLEGFLEFMFKSKVMPNIKTFALLLNCLPDNIEDEEKLLAILDKYKVKPNIEFFNILIKRRNFRKESEAAKDVLLLLNKYGLTPDIMTFGALALGCKSFQRAKTFIEEMKRMGCYPNTEIVGCLIKQACICLDFPFIRYVLNLMEEEEIKPNERILSNVERALTSARKNIILMEHGKEVNEFYQKKTNLKDEFKEFAKFYEKWAKRMKFQKEEDPWSQFKTDIVDKYKGEKGYQS